MHCSSSYGIYKLLKIDWADLALFVQWLRKRCNIERHWPRGVFCVNTEHEVVNTLQRSPSPSFIYEGGIISEPWQNRASIGRSLLAGTYLPYLRIRIVSYLCTLKHPQLKPLFLAFPCPIESSFWQIHETSLKCNTKTAIVISKHYVGIFPCLVTSLGK